MAKSVFLGPVRIEPEHRDALVQIAGQMRPEPSVSALVRLAVVEYIARRRAMVVYTDRLMAVADGETLHQV